LLCERAFLLHSEVHVQVRLPPLSSPFLLRGRRLTSISLFPRLVKKGLQCSVAVAPHPFFFLPSSQPRPAARILLLSVVVLELGTPLAFSLVRSAYVNLFFTSFFAFFFFVFFLSLLVSEARVGALPGGLVPDFSQCPPSHLALFLVLCCNLLVGYFESEPSPSFSLVP